MQQSACPLSPDRCPLCGLENSCAMLARSSADAKTPSECWCAQSKFPAELLAQVPAAARGNACICARCAAGSGSPA